jgi:hypothetical protein
MVKGGLLLVKGVKLLFLPSAHNKPVSNVAIGFFYIGVFFPKHILICIL